MERSLHWNRPRRGVEPSAPAFASICLGPMVRSFDVFDTCLSRRVVVPTDLFREMAPAIADVRGVEVDDAFVEELIWARIRGEGLSRERSAHEDVELSQIWKETCRLLGWPCLPAFAEAELEVERDCLYPIGETLRDVRAARSRGDRVIFISDTYFPRPFVEEILTRHGFMQQGDGLYVSSEVGKVKWTGSLYRHVLKEEGVPSSRVRHTGDNGHGDGEAARTVGILPRVVHPVRLSEVERRLAEVETYAGESSRWAAAMRMSRIHSDPGAVGGGFLAVSQYIAPVLMIFAEWVLTQARAGRIRRLYFASRDCQMLRRVVEIVASENDAVECSYLYVSRQSLLLPSVRGVSREAMPWMRRAFERHDLKSLLGKVGLRFSEAEAVWRPLSGSDGADFQLEHEDHWTRFWEILESPGMSEAILDRAGERRDHALTYFRQAGLLDGTPAALVDFGWSLTSQQALNRLLLEAGRGAPVPGLYLQHILDRPASPDTGPARALFPPLPPDRRSALGGITPHDYANVVEHTLGLADHESVDHYARSGDAIVPWSATGPIRSEGAGLARAVAKDVEAFARTHRDLVRTSTSAGPDAARERVAVILSSILRNPPPQIARELGSIRCSRDQNHGSERLLARPLTVADELASLCPGLTVLPRPDDQAPEWREGSLGLTRPGVRASSRALHWSKALVPGRLRGLVKRLLLRERARRTPALAVAGPDRTVGHGS